MTGWYRRRYEARMTQAQLAVDFINWGINVAFIAAVLFPIVIRPFWNWTDSDWGWNTVVFDLVVALALLPTWLHRVFDMNPHTYLFIWIQAASIWAVPVIVLWRGWIIWRVQRHGE